MAEQSSNATLFQEVRIFDGRNDALSAPSDVLIEGPGIARISASTSAINSDRTVTVVAGGGRVLMPGLIDAHWHAMFATLPMQVLMSADLGYTNLVAGREAAATLLRGFTAVRDIGGPVFGLKRAIDDGVVVGPRI
jgi:imidazolonepropionase-like amidohydrolase